MAGSFDVIARWEQDRLDRPTDRPTDEQTTEMWIGGTPAYARQRHFESSPMCHASAQNARGTKWLMLWGTIDDVTRPALHSERLAHALKLAGALVRLVPLVGAPHFGTWSPSRTTTAHTVPCLPGRFLAFLRTWCRWYVATQSAK